MRVTERAAPWLWRNSDLISHLFDHSMPKMTTRTIPPIDKRLNRLNYHDRMEQVFQYSAQTELYSPDQMITCDAEAVPGGLVLPGNG